MPDPFIVADRRSRLCLARQRSRNENTNGLIRQYIPKRMRLKTLSKARIQHIEDRLNHRPRKTLGYKTPHEVLFNLTPNSVAIRT